MHLRPANDPPTCDGAQDTLQELTHQQALLVQQHGQLQQEDHQQQQQRPVQDPSRWWHSLFANRVSKDEVTQRLDQQTVALRAALQQPHWEVQRELVVRLEAQGRALPAAVAQAVQQQMGRRDVVNGALLGAAVVLVRARSWESAQLGQSVALVMTWHEHNHPNERAREREAGLARRS